MHACIVLDTGKKIFLEFIPTYCEIAAAESFLMRGVAKDVGVA